MTRFAFLSDIHLSPGNLSEQGFRNCLRAASAQSPDFLVTGGDHIRDSLMCDLEEMESQWELYHRVLGEEWSLPVEPVIGNHDVWGWGVKPEEGAQVHPERGKPTALKQLGLSNPYRSFDLGGWRFIILDSILNHPNAAYTAGLDEEQFQWFADTISSTELPIVVISHIPILSVTPFFFGMNEASGDWIVPGPWMHLDARRIRDLLLEHPNVRLCLSGHMHQVDRVDFLGVTYMVGGSVSGACWDGPMERCEAGLSMVDLHPDGTFERKFHPLPCPVPTACDSP